MGTLRDIHPLLSIPLKEELSKGATYQQQSAHTVDVVENTYVIDEKKRSYTQQFSHIYYERLQILKPPLVEVALQRWQNYGHKDVKPIYATNILKIERSTLMYVIGTIYIDMPLKPNIIREITREQWLPPLPPLAKYTSEEDCTYLEDDTGRVRLIGSKLRKNLIVTGAVVAVLGSETLDGDFEVYDVCLPGLPPQNPLPYSQTPPNHSKWVALVSGLNMCQPEAPLLETQLLFQFLSGQACHQEILPEGDTIVRVIFAGNCIGKPSVIADEKQKRFGLEQMRFDVGPLSHLDSLLREVCKTVTVDMMPGSSDPATSALPQQPLHRSLFPYSQGYSSFSCTTNPHWVSVDGCNLLATSGQSIEDIKKVMDCDELDLLENFAYWRHIAPTAPDTLWCYPYAENDPFILKELPHVLISGNHSKFATKLVEGELGQKVRLIVLPRFDLTKQITLLNLDTLDCSTVLFI